LVWVEIPKFGLCGEIPKFSLCGEIPKFSLCGEIPAYQTPKTVILVVAPNN